MGSITMRPALDSDLSFLWWLHQVTMRDYVEKTWGWDSAFQEQRFREAFVADRDGLEIIEESAERIGCLRIVRDATRWFLVAIEIAPSHQGKGVGTLLVENVCQDADALGVPVDLRVLKVNPAIRLYWRLGFAQVGETNTHYLMRRGPARTA